MEKKHIDKSNWDLPTIVAVLDRLEEAMGRWDKAQIKTEFDKLLEITQLKKEELYALTRVKTQTINRWVAGTNRPCRRSTLEKLRSGLLSEKTDSEDIRIPIALPHLEAVCAIGSELTPCLNMFYFLRDSEQKLKFELDVQSAIALLRHKFGPID